MPHRFTSRRVASFAGQGLRRLKRKKVLAVYASALSQTRPRRLRKSRGRDAIAELYAAIAEAEAHFGRPRRRRRLRLRWVRNP